MEHAVLILVLLAIFGAGCAFMAWQITTLKGHVEAWVRRQGLELERVDWRPLARMRGFELFRTSNAQAIFTAVTRQGGRREVLTLRAGGYFLGPFTEKVELVRREPLPG